MARGPKQNRPGNNTAPDVSGYLAWLNRHKGGLAIVGAVIAALGTGAKVAYPDVKAYFDSKEIAATTIAESRDLAKRLLDQDCRLVGHIEHHLIRIVPSVKLAQLRSIQTNIESIGSDIDAFFKERRALLRAFTHKEANEARDITDKLVRSRDRAKEAIEGALSAFPTTASTQGEATASLPVWAHPLTPEQMKAELESASGSAVVAMRWAADVAQATKNPPCEPTEFTNLVPAAVSRFDTKIAAATGEFWEQVKDDPLAADRIVQATYGRSNTLPPNATAIVP